MISLESIEYNVGRVNYSKGEKLYQAGRVVRSEYEQDAYDEEDIASGTFLSSNEKKHDLEIYILLDEDDDDVTGEIQYSVQGACSCCGRFNCEHVAAILIAAVKGAGAVYPYAGMNSGARLSGNHPQLPANVGTWLDTLHLAKSASTVPPEPKKSSGDTIFYVFEMGRHRYPTIQPYKVYIKKDGSPGVKWTRYLHFDPSRPAKFLEASDLALMAKLLFYGVDAYGSIPEWPEGEPLWDLLRDVIETGRARAFDITGTAISWAAPRQIRFAWETTEYGGQRMQAQDSEKRPVRVLPFPTLVYLDETTGELGPAETGLPRELETGLAMAPEIPAVASTDVMNALAAFADEQMPLPRSIPVRKEQGMPQGVLTLYMLKQGLPKYDLLSRSNANAIAFPCARFRVAYDAAPDEVYPGAGDDLQFIRGENVIHIHRDFEEEDRLAKVLWKLAERYDAFPPEQAKHRYSTIEEVQKADLVFAPYLDSDNYADSRVISFSTEAVSQLRGQGWKVVFEDSWPFQSYEGTAEILAGIESSGMDWFSLALNMEIADQTVDLVPMILSIIEMLPTTYSGELEDDFDLDGFLADRVFYATLQDGRYVSVEGNRLGPFVSAFLETQGLSGFHIAEAGRAVSFAEALEGCDVAWSGGEEILSLGERLKGLEEVSDVAPPDGLSGELRPYQHKGYGWLRALSQCGFGGALADDMGLGKTIQALALLLHCHLEQEATHPSLLIVPTSLIGNWVREAAQFAPDLKFLTLHGPERKALFPKIPDHHVVLTTYPLVHRDHELLFSHEYELAILDEAQAVKNPASSIAKRIREIRARQRIAITGTPMENNLMELWSLFDWLIPGLLGNRKNFSKTFRTPIEKQGNTAKQRFLSTRLKPFLLRRTKDEVATDLPTKTEIDQVIPLAEGQRALYEAIRTAMDERVRQAIREKGLDRVRITILDALLKLRQVCCDPALVKLEAAKAVTQSSKRTRLMELLDELVSEGRKVLVFSQFVKMLRLIETDVIERGWEYAMLHGNTLRRDEEIARFQHGNASVFLISLKAGGLGLNLTAADTVILYDPWWNPAVERQAMDRAHRIGQDKPVFVYRLLAEGSVEATIRQMQAKKQALADALFENRGDRPMQLTDADIHALLAPIDSYVEPLENEPADLQLPARTG